MRRLVPRKTNAVDVERLYRSAPRTPPTDRPWVVVGMIASADGAAVVDGRSGGLGGPGDRRVFRALRALADVILVAAGTVRAEGYGPVRLAPAETEARVAAGQDPVPRIAVVSAALDLDWSSPLFVESDPRPMLITPSDADPGLVAEAREHAEVIACGSGRADLGKALVELGRRGSAVVVSEGGPSLNGALLAEQLMDELAVSVAPVAAGGNGMRIVRGQAPAVPLDMELTHVLEEAGYLFLRYVRR